MFGATNAQPSQPSAGVGLFGGANTNTQQSSSGGLFGNQQQANAPTTSLFGNTATQQQPQAGGSLFASLGHNQNQQKPQTSTLFGGLSKPNEASTFSSTQTSNPAQHQPQQASMFTTSIGQYTQRQQPVPGVRVTTNELRPTTRFTDLHEQLQSIIENIDVFIQQQMKFQQECAALNPSIDEQCRQMPQDVEVCSRALDAMQYAMENDAATISQAKRLTNADVANAKLSFNAIENLAVPQHYQATNMWALPLASRDRGSSLLDEENKKESNDGGSLISFFSSQADEMSQSLDGYRKSVAEVEAYLKGIEINTVQQMQQLSFTRGQDDQHTSADDQVRELVAVFKDFENGIINVAGKVGGVREQVQDLVLDDSQVGYGRKRRLGPR
ncbi:MAG: hypothetical protein Q9174_003198 [Haloplaca sp. 1 TL-2023]